MRELYIVLSLTRCIGHTLKSVETILERYLVRTRRMARNAFVLRLADAKKRAAEDDQT